MTQLERILGFLDDVERRCAGRIEPWSHGTAFFHDDYPKKYALNYLTITKEDPGLSVEDMVAEAHRLQGAAGLLHRRINGGPIAERYFEDFKKLGWQATHLVIMAHDGIIRPGAKQLPVVEIDFEELRAAQLQANLSDGNTPEVAEMLADSVQVLFDAVDLHFYACKVDGTIAGWCEHYLYDGISQTETVNTFESFRNRGVASSVVNHSLEVAYASGADLAFLIADNLDWPKELYGKLGFEPIGYIFEFTLLPDK